MTEIQKSIEIFLKENNLEETLREFKHERRQSPTASGKSYQQLLQIHKVHLKNGRETENRLREYLQKADGKTLKRFVDRARKIKQTAMKDIDPCIVELPFFRKMLEKVDANCELKAINKQKQAKLAGEGSILDQSRYYENEWDGENDIGYQVYEFPEEEFAKVVKEIHLLKNYWKQAIKQVAYPKAYFEAYDALRSKRHANQFDGLSSRLPATVNLGSNEVNKQDQDLYPLQSQGATYGCMDLRVIYNREKTGFQQERDLPLEKNDILCGRYKIISHLGQAQFSRAVEVEDLATSKHYCLKIIQNNKDYMDQSLDEIKLLRYLNSNCNSDESCLLEMYDFFYHREHLMILTQLLKDNLFDAYKNNPGYFSLRTVQVIAKQILLALEKMHSLHVIHCDLKPENILIKSYSNRMVKVIDVGSSVFCHDQPQLYVQTRSYRAPEVILGCNYDFKIDIWSLGCILAEIFSGEVLFESENIVELLAKMQGLRGPWPSWMIERGKEVEKYFTPELVLFEELVEQVQDGDNMRKQKTGRCRVFTPKMTNLKARLKCADKNFIDFLSKCLKLDPSRRISTREALEHPFITTPLPA